MTLFLSENSNQPNVAAKVAFLANPEVYPARSDAVEVIETHTSWVFLTETLVHKLKKPVKLRYVDLSTLDARRVNCEREVILNRRLAPRVYLGSIPLTFEPDATLKLSGEGAVVDWLVQMKRLPADRMLDRLIKKRALAADDLRRFTETMTRFYATCRRPPIEASGYRSRLAATVATHRDDLWQYRDLLPFGTIRELADALLQYLRIDGRKFDDRVAAGRIVEGHGDLRPEHVCLEQEVSVFDCLEFSDDLRILDVSDELAFLILECERMGGEDVGRAILSSYCDRSGDLVDDRVFAFYKATRTLLRAKLAIWHLDDRPPSEHGRWLAQAEKYLEFAASAVGKL